MIFGCNCNFINTYISTNLHHAQKTFFGNKVYYKVHKYQSKNTQFLLLMGVLTNTVLENYDSEEIDLNYSFRDNIYKNSDSVLQNPVANSGVFVMP